MMQNLSVAQTFGIVTIPSIATLTVDTTVADVIPLPASLDKVPEMGISLIPIVSNAPDTSFTPSVLSADNRLQSQELLLQK